MSRQKNLAKFNLLDVKNRLADSFTAWREDNPDVDPHTAIAVMAFIEMPNVITGILKLALASPDLTTLFPPDELKPETVAQEIVFVFLLKFLQELVCAEKESTMTFTDLLDLDTSEEFED